MWRGGEIRPFFRAGVAADEMADRSPVTTADRTAEQPCARCRASGSRITAFWARSSGWRIPMRRSMGPGPDRRHAARSLRGGRFRHADRAVA